MSKKTTISRPYLPVMYARYCPSGEICRLPASSYLVKLSIGMTGVVAAITENVNEDVKPPARRPITRMWEVSRCMSSSPGLL
jgi:hypothetical protein